VTSTFDFRAAQESARRASNLLVLGFLVMVLGVGLAIGTLGALALGGTSGSVERAPLDLDMVLAIAVVVVLAVLSIALVRVLALGGDGAKVARTLGGEEVLETTTNAYHRRYLNVVQEMALAAGMPAPRAFVIKNENGINAFAAGGDPSRAVVGITHGALAKLNREELSAVIGHEIAHIAHRDTRLNTRLMGMVFGLVAIYWLGRLLMRQFIFMPRRRDSRGALPAIVIAVGLLIIGALGVLAGRVLQAAVSRRREALADAGGVQFTRNPQGLANALKKIGASAGGSRVAAPHAEEARHLFFAEAAGGLAGLLATHPPLVKRIRALEPTFDPASDPVWSMDERMILRDARSGLAIDAGPTVGPWGARPDRQGAG